MKYLVPILGLALALCGYGYYHEIQSGAAKSEQIKSLTKAADRAVKRAKSDRQALVAREAENAVQTLKLAQAQQALSEALQRNSDWSNTDVPTDVQNALLGRSDGLPGPSDSPRLRTSRQTN